MKKFFKLLVVIVLLCFVSAFSNCTHDIFRFDSLDSLKNHDSKAFKGLTCEELKSKRDITEFQKDELIIDLNDKMTDKSISYIAILFLDEDAEDFKIDDSMIEQQLSLRKLKGDIELLEKLITKRCHSIEEVTDDSISN